MDGFWHVDRQRLPSGMGRGERVAGNAVGLRTKIRISGIGEPALFARMGVNPLLDVWQLLRPIDTGVAQVFVCVCRSAPGFVGVRHLCREDCHGRDDVENDQPSAESKASGVYTARAPLDPLLPAMQPEDTRT